MPAELTVPFWVAILAGSLAFVSILDWIIVPIVRAILARRRERSIAVLNRQLRLRIAPFKLARRKDLIAQLLLDADVQKAIEEEATRTGKPIAAVGKIARIYAKEIVPSFSAAVYFRVGARLARWLATALYRVRIGASDAKAVEGIDPSATVVFVINHRSNMDYVLVTYLAAQSSALSYAVGEWARVPGLAGLIRLMGAYFIRRDSGNQLYRRVLSRYVHLATAAGVTQAVFPEGGLSRNGALQSPKLGLIAYMVTEFDPQGARDIVFVPVGLNYDRVLKDRMLTAAAAAAKGQRPKFGFNPLVFAGFLARNVIGRIAGRWYRYGYACVSFGRPVSLCEHLRNRGFNPRAAKAEQRFAEIERLGERLIGEVGRAVPALPVSLAALALLCAGGQPLSRFELKGRVFTLMRDLERSGADVYIPRADLDYAVDVGVRMLILRRLVVEERGLLHPVAEELGLLGYYANALVHHIALPAFAVGEAASGVSTSPTGAADRRDR